MDHTKTKERILDDYLVAAARLGDRRAFGLLAMRWNRKLLAHAWRLLTDEESAKDAVQEAWAEIVGGIAKLNDAGLSGVGLPDRLAKVRQTDQPRTETAAVPRDGPCRA